MNYLFDVDGTLTEPRRPISKEMQEALIKLPGLKYTVTGSPLWMYQQQIPKEISLNLAGEFWCSGNHSRIGNRFVTRTFEPPKGLFDALFNLWSSSLYPSKRGTYMEARPGALYFAICGADATEEERAQYAHWNRRFWEREANANLLKQGFPDLEIVTGGVVSIDILNKYRDKSQVLEYIHGDVTFLGDKTDQGGNDHSLAEAVKARGGRVVPVKSPKDTLKFLEEECSRT